MKVKELKAALETLPDDVDVKLTLRYVGSLIVGIDVAGLVQSHDGKRVYVVEDGKSEREVCMDDYDLIRKVK